MTALPLKTSISDTYPNPSNATARAGFAQLWDVLNEMSEKSELDLASAATCDIGGQASRRLRITGTTTITSFGTNYRGPILLRMAGIVTITHDGTVLICPGATNLVTAANDILLVSQKATVSGTLDGWQVARIARGSGLTPIAEGGTGASTAAAAFTALKQAATTSATGVAELATDAEAQAGTDATRVVTPDNLGAVALGLGQTWQNLTASRAASTSYTNSTGRSIWVSVSLATSLACTINYTVGGVTASGSSYYTSAGTTYASFLVPNGVTYSCVNNGGTSVVATWMELR